MNEESSQGISASPLLTQAGNRAEACRPAVALAKAGTSAGTFVTGSYSNSAGTRAYKLYTPTFRDGGARPLIVMLHGCSQTPDDFAAGTRMNVCADEHECFVLYPEQATSANASKCWNWFNIADQRRDEGEPSNNPQYQEFLRHLACGAARDMLSAIMAMSGRIAVSRVRPRSASSGCDATAEFL